MPRACETVLEAGLTYREGWENRLTAILASVMDQHRGFASALFDRVGLPTAEVYEAYTEEWVTPDRRVDMQVLAKDAKGAVVAQIWSEHKRIGGTFGTNQREHYLAALEREPGEGRLLTVVADVRNDNSEDQGEPADDEANEDDAGKGVSIGDGDELPSRPGEPSPEDPRWWGMTWQLLAEIAEGAGQAYPDPWGGAGWADKALRDEAPAAQRALYELLWYLEREGYAVVAPLAVEHIQAIRHAADTFEVSLTLVSRAADRMSPLIADEEAQLDDELHGCSQDFVVEGLWPERFDAGIELLLWDDDSWTDKPHGEPSVAVGVSFDSEWHRPLSKNTEWVHRIREAGFCFAEYDGWLCCYATIPLSEVVEKGGRTIAEQSHYIASWGSPLLRRLVSEEFDPGAVEPPAKSKRARRAKTSSRRAEAEQPEESVELT